MASGRRWTVNYLASTACVLQGLARVGGDMSESWVRRAVAFVLERQNDDGGWGELGELYRVPALARPRPGCRRRSPAWCYRLIDAGEASSDAVRRGVAYLLDQQRPDGSWPHGDWLQAIIPADTFYILAEAARRYPMEALARWLAAA